jgi:hypothetical protein
MHKKEGNKRGTKERRKGVRETENGEELLCRSICM